MACPRAMTRRRFLEGTAMALAASSARGAEEAKKIRILIVTGGHGFDQKAFLGMFEGQDDLAATHAPQRDHCESLEDISQWPYDVIVQYHLAQNITEKRKANFLALMAKGVGVLTLHHALSAFQGWADYRTVIGGRSYLRPTVVNGVTFPQTTDKPGLTYTAHIEDADHPITRGLKDFTIEKDEPYHHYVVDAGSHALLTTDCPASDKAIGWVHACRKARTVYMQPGHTGATFQNPSYRALLLRAIRWAAGRLPE
ncbi:MAG TPA: ThuA domain-containing protein [Planctomycetota bacterium]|nr:ThuA domain-containing protein [Planctomycetota bacterium]